MSARAVARSPSVTLAAPPSTDRRDALGNDRRATSVGWGEGGDEVDALSDAALDEGSRGDVAQADGADATAPAPLRVTVENDQASPGGARDRTRVGVGEKSWFTANRDGGSWSVNGGSSTVEADGALAWTAPSTAGSFNVVFTLGAERLSLPVTVAAPATVAGAKTGELGHPAGVHGAGMTLNLTIGPTDVSFANVGWLEEQGTATPTGIFAGRALPIDHNPDWSPIGGANDIQDRADHHDFPRPWDVGTMTYDVHQLYRVGNAGAGTRFATVTQVHEMSGADGTSQTRKAGASSARRTP